MADEKNMKLAQATFKSLCEMLDEKKWHYSKDEENLVISCGARGDDLPMDIRIEVDAERELILLLSPMPFVIPEEKRTAMAVAASCANHSILDGSFDFDYINGVIFFRLTSSYRDSLIGKPVFEYILLCSCVTIDRFNDKFLMVAKSDMDNDAIVNYMKS